MIEIGIDSKGRLAALHQYATPPLVYLDHWALMEIAASYPDRFIKALGHREGTLALSFVNFVEISEISGQAALLASSFLRRAFPRIVFIDVEAGSVRRREDNLLLGGHTEPPLQQEWLDLYFNFLRRSLNPIDPGEFVKALQNQSMRCMFRETFEEARIQTIALVDEARGLARQDNAIRERLVSKTIPKGDPRLPPTRYVFLQAFKYLVGNNLNLDSGNHLKDFWHTVVPISYCHYVLIDKAWREVARQIQETLRRSGLLTFEAAVYSRPNLLEFLQDFEDQRSLEP